MKGTLALMAKPKERFILVNNNPKEIPHILIKAKVSRTNTVPILPHPFDGTIERSTLNSTLQKTIP
ncbi:hypothetical protein HBHAL_4270 [Halobacillus halophilus DSM 2266]|uniref:Uncharacterized protein n=1 Tax=Halobacillus halophilus (strain ATCC 35676 / DSM 2266 / JCM 20832 / KCTC 3685 / LMG 17431 / NBRC 102448 / NCIMB 2269) TaxID=866895 RepID=I0JR42_HALH3|nr:hypothetical protein HBHAL_4270 [Halobacillus halophilus DSM 2266]